MNIEATFRLQKDEPMSFKYHVERLYLFFEKLREYDSFSRDLYLTGDSLNEALLYPVYEGNGEITKAADAVLETEYKGKAIRSFGIWNGDQTQGNGLGVSYHFDDSGVVPCTFSVEFPKAGVSRLGGSKGVQSLVSAIAPILRPTQVTVAPANYFDKYQVFKDRPGVGWMLYLPKVLTVQQVPEARGLVPIMDGKIQIGTIVVSVTDGDFDSRNPEHIKIANAIEVRLVDQDLLPRFADL